MSDTVLVQFGSGDCAEMLRTSGPRHAAYAKKHGMDFHVETDRLCEQRRPEWEKVFQMRARLQEYPTVIWLDADTVIVDMDVDLRTALPEGRELAIRKCFYHLLGRSIQKLGALYNTGVMVARNTHPVRMFFEELWCMGPLTKQRCRDAYDRDWTDAYTCLREEAVANYILQGNRGETCPPGTPPIDLPRMHDMDPRFNSFTDYQVDNPVVKAWHGLQRTTVRKRMIEELEKLPSHVTVPEETA